MGKSRIGRGAPKQAPTEDLWGADGGTRAVVKPQPVRTSADWTIEPEMVPLKKGDVRPRATFYRKPNQRAAVAVPVAGQSYNPDDTDHQAALATAAIKVKDRKRQHEAFVKKITDTSALDKSTRSALVSDGVWEEEVNDGCNEREARRVAARKGRAEAPKSSRKKKVLKVTRDAIRRSFRLRGQPDRDHVADQVEDVDDILEAVQDRNNAIAARAARKKVRGKAGQEIKSFGRYFHTPNVIDVATSTQLVGSLRHLSGASAVHGLEDRMKSLEERNLVPARMRHTYNKRRVLKPQGQVMIRREPFGMLPDPNDHSLV